MKKTMESNIKKPLPVGSEDGLAPFVLWGDRYYGLCVQDGSVTTEPDQNKDWKEYHLDYRGGDIWEIEVCPSENTGWTVWRGKLPSREIFVTVMQNIEDAPPIDWANDEMTSPDKPQPTPRKMSTETKPESTQMPLGPGGRRPSTCSGHIGPGQVKAAAIWEDFKGDELRFVDVLELCSCLMVNVAAKSQSTDNEISTMVRRLMHDMRRNAARQNTSNQTPPPRA